MSPHKSLNLHPLYYQSNRNTEKHSKQLKTCAKSSTFGMCDFNEGMEVLRLVGCLWDGGKKVLVGEATGTVLL